MNSWRILIGDVREQLATLPAGCVRTCVTSPPYWGLRDYGVSGQLGLESTPEAYCAAMVAVFAEVRRVLADDGTLWLNLGDTYAGNRGYQVPDSKHKDVGNSRRMTVSRRRDNAPIPCSDIRVEGLKPKDLIGVPWRVAFALQADGWYLRSDIIWSKPNPMPESVTDRPTKAHEYIFLLSKSRSYYYDAGAIAELGTGRETFYPATPQLRALAATGMRNDGNSVNREPAFTRNKRSVWSISTQPYPEAHFATYPEDLIEPCILAGSAVGDTVLDPFTGSGTTGAVAIRHQRNFIGCELNPSYVELARKRIGNVAPMFAQEVA